MLKIFRLNIFTHFPQHILFPLNGVFWWTEFEFTIVLVLPFPEASAFCVFLNDVFLWRWSPSQPLRCFIVNNEAGDSLDLVLEYGMKQGPIWMCSCLGVSHRNGYFSPHSDSHHHLCPWTLFGAVSSLCLLSVLVLCYILALSVLCFCPLIIPPWCSYYGVVVSFAIWQSNRSSDLGYYRSFPYTST